MALPDMQADRVFVLRQLIDTLFDFQALPGRYPLTLREPRILFDSSHDVLLMAAGRPVEGLALESNDMPRVKRAASFFVRTAMLRPGSDHYTLLGLERGFNKNSLRLHYRILIRLTHPDFVGNSEVWPAGSATRINLAHDVLSSAVRQAEYNQTLTGSERRRILPMHSVAAVLPRPAARNARFFGYGPRALSSAGMAAVLLLLTILWLVNTDGARETQVAQTGLSDSRSTAFAESRHSERPQVDRQASAVSATSALSPGSADKGSKDFRARESRDAGAAASRQALEASQVQPVAHGCVVQTRGVRAPRRPVRSRHIRRRRAWPSAY